jgi:transcriptional regulator with PAS, ATPase and Fis domain
MGSVESLAQSPVAAKPRVGKFVVASAQMLELLKVAERAAASDAKILITGETGVGKDLVARHVHTSSVRRRNEYVPVNCAGVTESLLETELFGHVKGSFTGAYRDKRGKLQLAHRGTLFLDEIGEMSLRMQALLLRFLENGEIQAVGADAASTTVDVRVITATNRNLSEMVAAGQFREDLLYRLRVIHLHVSPLRERPGDVRSLFTHFLAKSGRPVSLTPEAWAALEQYRWPGNVRELQNVVEQMRLVTSDEPLGIAHVPELVKARQAILPSRERRRQVADELYQAIVTGGYSFWEHVHPLFLSRDITRHDIRELVRRALSVSGGNYRGVLRLLGMPLTDYKRFMNFLTTHDCRANFREFRDTNVDLTKARSGLSPLPAIRVQDVSIAAEAAAAKVRIA